MKKISTIIVIAGAVFFFTLGAGFSSKTMDNQNKDIASNNVSIQTNQNEENNTQESELKNPNNITSLDNEETNKNESTENDIVVDETESKEENETNSEVVESIASSGAFEGFADDNFIEVNTNGTYNVFKIENETIKSNLRNKDIGSNINFIYIEKDGLKIIKELN